MTAARKCPSCRRAAVRERGETGRTITYRVFADLALPDDADPDLWRVWRHLLGCRAGSGAWPDADESVQQTAAWAGARGTEEDQVGKPHLSHRRLERLVSVSYQGYLSRVQIKPVCVSAPLVALLMLIAESPVAQLAALRWGWGSAGNEGSAGRT